MSDKKERLTDALQLLARASLKVETVAESIDEGHSERALTEIRDLLADIRSELRGRTERMQAVLIAATADQPFPLLLFDGIYGSRTTYNAWCRQGMPHCYIEGKLCVKPSVFFAEVAKRAEPTSKRGEHFRSKAGEGEKPADGKYPRKTIPPVPRRLHQ